MRSVWISLAWGWWVYRVNGQPSEWSPVSQLAIWSTTKDETYYLWIEIHVYCICFSLLTSLKYKQSRSHLYIFWYTNWALVLWSTRSASSAKDHIKENLETLIVQVCGWMTALLQYFLHSLFYFSFCLSITILLEAPLFVHWGFPAFLLVELSSHFVLPPTPSQLLLLCRPYRWPPTMAGNPQEDLATWKWGTYLWHTKPTLVKNMDRSLTWSSLLLALGMSG